MAYSYPSCDLLVGGASSQIYRLNLDQGRFLSSLETDLPGVNTVDINPAHQLWAFGGDNGLLELWHPNNKKRISSLDIAGCLSRIDQYSNLAKKSEITSLKFHDDGLTVAVGVSTGQVLLFDLRRPSPLLVKDHQYGYPIKSIQFHNTGNIISGFQIQPK